MAKHSATVGLRLPPFTKTDLQNVVQALKDEGVGLKQDDLVAVLLDRATVFIGDKKALDKLGDEIRAYRKKAEPLGF
jgi:hypothetical protein